MKAGLLAEGIPEEAITTVSDTSTVIDYCLDMAREGDLLVLGIYDPEFDSTWETLQRLSSEYKRNRTA
jgi:hypothetical protein